MQAANLLAIAAPVNQAKGGPAGLFAPAEGQGADAQGAEATNPFAEALAALMAATGPAQAQDSATPSPKGQVTETATAPGDARSQGLQTALAAVTANGSSAKGLIDPAGPVGATTVTGEQTEEIAAASIAPTPPDTAQADEALAKGLASPPPRAERAESLAKGPQAPPWALAPTPVPDAAPVVTTTAAAEPVVEAAPAPVTVSDETATLVASAQIPAKTAQGAEHADGKALGKTNPKGGKSAAAPGHTEFGQARGVTAAPGQLKTAQTEDTAIDAASPETEADSAAPQLADNAIDAPGQFAAEQARAMPAPLHGDGDRLAAHTVAHLASQIVSKADGKATRFDVQLDPAGLGKVDVKIEIGRGGEISAALSFDNPQAAAEMRSRAGELRQALEQAGFDLSKGSLSFDMNSQNPGRQPFDQRGEPPRPAWARGAFTDLAASPDAALPALRRMIAAGGVDVTI